MRILTPEEKAFQEFSKFKEVKVAPTASDLDAAKQHYLRIEDSLETAWEYLREEAEETLKLSPDDHKALETLRDYREYKRVQALPDAKRAGLILSKPSTSRRGKLSKKGQWVRDRKYGWLVRSAGEVGDVIEVRKRDGTEERVKLTERVMPGLGFFKAIGIGRVQ
jgi:hypothetical protein